jgi:hypothetical protein
MYKNSSIELFFSLLSPQISYSFCIWYYSPSSHFFFILKCKVFCWEHGNAIQFHHHEQCSWIHNPSVRDDIVATSLIIVSAFTFPACFSTVGCGNNVVSVFETFWPFLFPVPELLYLDLAVINHYHTISLIYLFSVVHGFQKAVHVRSLIFYVDLTL